MSLRRRREREGMSRCEQNISRRAPDGTDCTTYEKRKRKKKKKKKKKKKTCEYTCSSPPQFYHIVYIYMKLYLLPEVRKDLKRFVWRLLIWELYLGVVVRFVRSETPRAHFPALAFGSICHHCSVPTFDPTLRPPRHPTLDDRRRAPRPEQ